MSEDACSIGFILVQERQFVAQRSKGGNPAPEPSHAGFIGCFMVTDERGYPKEFRITTPVKPTAIQRAIYGSELEAYVSQELVAMTLVKEASRTPEILLVNNQSLASFRSPSETPVALLYGEEEDIVLSGSGHLADRVGSNGRELAYEVTEGFEAAAQRLLALCASFFNPSDAFDRMSSALDVLIQEDERFR